MLRVKTLKMTFFFLPKQHPLTRKTLPDGVFYPIDDSSAVIVRVPHGCVPVKCIYSGDFFKEHSWTNTFTNQVFEDNHPLNLEVSDSTFYDSFYEITKIKCLTFGKGEAWCPKTNLKIRVEKTNVSSIWNPFFQRYDQQCDCFRIGKVKKEMDRGRCMYFDKFTQCPHLFFDVYCNCGMRDNRSHHTDSDSD